MASWGFAAVSHIHALVLSSGTNICRADLLENVLGVLAGGLEEGVEGVVEVPGVALRQVKDVVGTLKAEADDLHLVLAQG